ncbi:Sodium/hydrogen exchanger 7 [Symbiodinium microadriaticum]|uniref:Sodium/hydrogen exchanger 7 n=1 Tax=Symbiodinium microadriaticum TaxID=2951 RepID=A0A1Q9D0Y8_SYMMI|nr:Sodium/hydrogen exchanger 7 [Symbiodinium microadriaticum]
MAAVGDVAIAYHFATTSGKTLEEKEFDGRVAWRLKQYPLIQQRKLQACMSSGDEMDAKSVESGVSDCWWRIDPDRRLCHSAAMFSRSWLLLLPTAVLAASDERSAHSHPHEALLFPFFAMLIGMCITHLGSRCPVVASIPYTVSLLIAGVLLGAMHIESSQGLGTLSRSIALWMDIDPHVILYSFLPVLLFGDALSIVWHDFRRTAMQCAVLAGPGVLIGTGLMFIVSKYIFPYGWGDYECAAFASVLAATDPVAVVGLLKEMGASRVLTMQIAGESLLNDGVAIVVWLVFFDFMKGNQADGGAIIGSFLRLAAGGTAFGVFCGVVAARWASLASDRLVHTDALVQVSLTITAAYLAFFIGENELKVSGVLAAIFAALMMSKFATPLVCHKEGMLAVWHTMEYFGNTVLFVLCGLFAYESCSKVAWADFGWLLLLYILATLARGFMVAVLWPAVNLVGGSDVTKTTWKECAVMVWGGLRGAVGLALALSMRNELRTQGKTETADRMVFFVSGFAALTLLINATTCGALLQRLELTKPPEAQVVILTTLRKVLVSVSKKSFEDRMAEDGRFKAVHQQELDALLEHLDEELAHHGHLDNEHAQEFVPQDHTQLVGKSMESSDEVANEITTNVVPEAEEPSVEILAEKVAETGTTDQEATSAADPAPKKNAEKKEEHWWWGFEQVRPASGAMNKPTGPSFLEKRYGVATRGTHQERIVYRKLFLSMLRAEYMRLMDTGMLPRRAEGAELLLASIDAADDFAAIGLNDWKILQGQLLKRRGSVLVKARELLSPYFAFAPVPTVSGNMVFDLFTVVAFIDAHHTVCHRLLESDCLNGDAREDVVKESSTELEAAHQLLKENCIGAKQISKVRTMQLATMLFEVQKEQVSRWLEMGVISDKEMEELLHIIKHGLEHSQETMKKKVLNQVRKARETMMTLRSNTGLLASRETESRALTKLRRIPVSSGSVVQLEAGAVRGKDGSPDRKRRRLSPGAVCPGDAAGPKLVMDVGANYGQSSERYLAAGFKVVAVEPNPAAAAGLRDRLQSHVSAGSLVLEEKALWNQTDASGAPVTSVMLYVNKEDSEWSSCLRNVGRRYDTEAEAVNVETLTLADLFVQHGTPWYLKLDTEGADGMVLQQLSALDSKPAYLSFELNSLGYISQAFKLGYQEFKVVPQSRHKAEHLQDEHGRPLTHAGNFGEDAVGVAGEGWQDEGATLDLCRSLCLVHDAEADAPAFANGPPRYVDRDFATLRACFPIESLNDEEWYDIHCRHSSVSSCRQPACTGTEAVDKKPEPDLPRSYSAHPSEMASKPLPGWVAFSTSGVGGIFGWIFIHPVNTLAIRMNLASMQNPGAKLNLFTFAMDTVQKSGFASLYNGLGAGIWRQVFYASSRYGLFQVFRDTLTQYREMDFAARLSCATAAGGLAALFSCPCEVSLVRLSNDASLPEAERRNYKGVMDCAQRIAREEGVTAFWRGSMPFVTRACLVGATQAPQLQFIVVMADLRSLQAMRAMAAQLSESTWRPWAGFQACPSQSLPVYSQPVRNHHPPSLPAPFAAFAYVPPKRGRSPSRLSEASTDDMGPGPRTANVTRSVSEPSQKIRHDLEAPKDPTGPLEAPVVDMSEMVTPRRSEHFPHNSHLVSPAACPVSDAAENCTPEYTTRKGHSERRCPEKAKRRVTQEPKVAAPKKALQALWQPSGSPDASSAKAVPAIRAPAPQTYASNFARAQSSLKARSAASKAPIATKPRMPFTGQSRAKAKAKPKAMPRAASATALKAKEAVGSAPGGGTPGRLRDENAALQAELARALEVLAELERLKVADAQQLGDLEARRQELLHWSSRARAALGEEENDLTSHLRQMATDAAEVPLHLHGQVPRNDRRRAIKMPTRYFVGLHLTATIGPSRIAEYALLKQVAGGGNVCAQVTCDMPLARASAGPGTWPGPCVQVPERWQSRYKEALGHLLLPDVTASARSIGGDSILPTQVMTTLALSSKWDLAIAFLSEIFRSHMEITVYHASAAVKACHQMMFSHSHLGSDTARVVSLADRTFMTFAAGTFLLQLALHVDKRQLLPKVLCQPGQEALASYWATGPGKWTAGSGCAASHREKDFSYFTQTWAAGFTALNGEPAYEDPAIRTADGVFVWDAEYCLVSGFLDLPNKTELLENYSAVMKLQESACEAEPLKSLTTQTPAAALQGVFSEVDEMFAVEHKKTAEERAAPLLQPGILARVNAAHCSAGSYSCMIHFCLSNFCRLGDGRVGQGCQCHSDFTLQSRIGVGTDLYSEWAARWEMAIALLVACPGLRVQPNEFTYNSVISACERSGQWVAALAVFDAMPSAIPRNVVTFGAVISACEKAARWQEALALTDLMESQGVARNAIIFCAAITACGQGEQWQPALSLLQQMTAESLERFLLLHMASL